MKTKTTHGLPLFLGLLLLPTWTAADEGIFDLAPPTPPSVIIGNKVIDDSEPWGLRGTKTPVRLRSNSYVATDRPVMLRLESGVTLRVWAMTTGSDYDLVLSRFESGSWTVPQTLAGSPGDELDPRLAVDPADGSVHLVYWIKDEWPRVMYMRAPADLSSWSEPLCVSEPFERAVRPSVALHRGKPLVVYEAHAREYGGTPRQIVLATREPWGFSTEVVATTDFEGPNVPEIHVSEFTLSVVWIDSDGVMGFTRRDGQGVWAPVSATAISRPANGQRASTESADRRSGGRRK